jgi:hypothetical protein
MVETVILMPLYMILVLGLIFFGYSTLSKQKEAAATNYALLKPGRQPAADIMPAFFPWNSPPVTNLRQLPDGSQATAGDATLRVHDVQDVTDFYAPAWPTAPSIAGIGATFDSSRLAEYLWLLAQKTRVQHFQWQYGKFEEVIDTEDSYQSKYLYPLFPHNPPDPDPPPSQTRYTRGATYGLNCGQDAPWLDRRQARLEYLYTPPFFSHVYGEQAMTPSEYFDMGQPEPSYTPNYKTESHVIARGEGARFGTLDSGADHVEMDMAGLLDQPRLPDPLDDTTLNAVAATVGGGSLWEAR